MTCEVFERIDLTLGLVCAPLQDLSARFGRDADVAFIEIYAARCFLETSGIFTTFCVLTAFTTSIGERPFERSFCESISTMICRTFPP